ncbi:flavin reductase family protein [Alcaligenaceae bacterium]|nr:flavin reductase family protein [Alcaligenaceae bacterium]
MDIDLQSLDDKARYKLLMSSVVPRPIALITSLCQDGTVNAAPFSLFNIMSSSPPIVVVGIDTRETGFLKDTGRNIEANGEFVVNLVNEELSAQMNLCATGLPYGASEIDYASLEVTPSVQVAPPRIAKSPIGLECKLENALKIGNGRVIVIGRIVHYHIDDRYYDAEKQYVLSENIGLVARMHGRSWYARTSDLYELARPEAPVKA